MPLAELLNALDYTEFPQYYLKTDRQQAPDIAPLFRSAKDAGVDGIYVVQSSPQDKHFLPVRPAVYVAEAQTPAEARAIHCALWNLGQAPFLIVVLPNHIRVYTGFDYSRESHKVGLLKENVSPDESSIRTELAEFCAQSINTGNLWRERAEDLRSDKRVDKRLLKSLSDLSKHLREEKKLRPEVAHALIGKYVYIRYLRDRNILSDQWLQHRHIDLEQVLGRHATVEGLRTLIEILNDQLNGSIFPLDFNAHTGLTDDIIALVASIFKGDQLSGKLQQLSLDDFKIYDFEYIPIETLSSIYEQFLHAEGKGKTIGAFYTPEYLADYLLAEMNVVKPLRKGMKILDPSCGSGVFLVLTYRRLIEIELAGSSGRKLQVVKLLELLSSLYGVEREVEACYVTEFSLILTLLHYADLAELLSEKKQLPFLHNTQIFHDDFDDSSPLYEQQQRFDWIIGNPPWIQAEPQKDQLVLTWMEAHKTEQPVSSQNVAEAFSWRALDLLDPEGCIGLILPAASLYKLRSKSYRQYFFHTCEVLRMTNFSNLRHVLFEGRAVAPAITILYRKASAKREKLLIDHYGPFSINQTPNANGDMWTIIMNENEFQTVSPYEAERGDAATWKIALGGTHRDKRAIGRLRQLFPTTLGQLCQENGRNGWHLHEGAQLRLCLEEDCDGLELVPDLAGKKCLDTTLMTTSERLFSIPDRALELIPPEECYLRKRGGKKGLLTSEPPHIVMNASWKYVVYSDKYFVIKPRQIGLSAPPTDAGYLRALSVYLSSSIVRYYLFFQVPEWGIEHDVITLSDVKSIPVPPLTPDTIEKLAMIQKELAHMEFDKGSSYTQAYVDEQIAHIFKLPSSMSILATAFNRVRSTLIGGNTDSVAVKPPKEDDLRAYAQEMADELDAFTSPKDMYHKVIITTSPQMNCCTVEILKSDHPIPIEVEKETADNSQPFAHLLNGLNRAFSQWTSIQRGLRMFDGPKVHLYKVPRLIDWTRTQALNDADDLIAEVLVGGMSK